ncbi:MAG: endolytic transglycosylase MltG [Alphaproteobacteria bacterium]|nr:endolytic transglycosylase MltG [Alphaproteobacteria bacterium]
MMSLKFPNKFPFILLMMVLLLSAAIGLFFYGPFGYCVPGKRDADISVIIRSQTSSLDIAKQLTDAKILPTPWIFLVGHKLSFVPKKLRAGEYLIAKDASPLDIARQMDDGRTVIRKLTIPEGYTVAQIISLLFSTDTLSGTITSIPREGSLLPETYLYSYGEDRRTIIKRLENAMTAEIARLWACRQSDDGLIRDPSDALTLASIIEKETAVACERKKVAGVFTNRLKLGMRLQSDPTVIYAITAGTALLGRPLKKSDLLYFSPYNTYVYGGLPPNPIACPSKASIEAALNPDKTDALYFVADGSGGHAFSKTLDEHNRRVSAWRKLVKIQGKNNERN